MNTHTMFKRRSLWLGLFIFAQAAVSHADTKTFVPVENRAETRTLANPEQEAAIKHYESRYNLGDPFEKLVGNTGDGFEPLYGVRNFRAVLKGVLYRGGGNNYYHRTAPRDNMNPLPNDGLQALCKEGFADAIYLYTKNFETAPAATNCVGPNNLKNKLTYMQASPHDYTADADRVLKMIHNKLMNTADARPIYVHCWNGWHASGYISTLALRQFCGVSAADGVKYWDLNTDGINKGAAYDAIRAKILAFKPNPRMNISPALRAKVCFDKTW